MHITIDAINAQDDNIEYVLNQING